MKEKKNIKGRVGSSGEGCIKKRVKKKKPRDPRERQKGVKGKK